MGLPTWQHDLMGHGEQGMKGVGGCLLLGCLDVLL